MKGSIEAGDTIPIFLVPAFSARANFASLGTTVTGTKNVNSYWMHTANTTKPEHFTHVLDTILFVYPRVLIGL
jgi:hypothetical protein